MNLIQLKSIKTKDKKHLLNEICLMYKKMKSSEALSQKAVLFLSDSRKLKNKIRDPKAISVFDTILEILPIEQKEIIEKDFIERANSHWYRQKYSKTKYYQVKNAAMDNFLYLFYK